MDIIPLGHATFKLKGKKASVVCDPFSPEATGLKPLKNITADIVTVSHDHHDHNQVKSITASEEGKEVVVFNGPGEYESHGVEVTGIPTFHDAQNGKERGKNTMYLIQLDGLDILHCGDLGHKLTDEQTDLIENVDILLIPVGGTYTIDADIAAKVVAQLEPSIVVPMHYQRMDLKADLVKNLAPVSEFLKEIGHESVTPQPKLTITKDKLPPELSVVVLE